MVILKLELTKKPGKQTILTDGFFVRPISVAEQYGKLMLWAEASETTPLDNDYKLDVDVVWTGRHFDTRKPYIGTVVMSDGLAYHVFASGGVKPGEEADHAGQ